MTLQSPTMGQLRDQWEHDNPGSVADTAIPQTWADKVFEAVKEWPFGFVWGYLPGSVFGSPVPLTDSAKAIYERLPANLR